MISNLLLPHILLFLLHWECGNSVAIRFNEEPDKVIYSDPGQDLSLRWSFGVTKETMALHHSKDQSDREFLFGEWTPPGKISKKILVVKSHVILTKLSYERKFVYVGNVSSGCSICCAEIKLLNLTRADCKTYGVSVSIPPNTDLLQNQTRIVLKQTAKIVRWPLKNLTIHEGNAASIRCKAKGQPPPLVIIQLSSETETSVMASGTGEAEWMETSVKPKHEGTYHCVAYQDNVEADRKTMSLKVMEEQVSGDKTTTPPANSASTIALSGKWIVPIIIFLVLNSGLAMAA